MDIDSANNGKRSVFNGVDKPEDDQEKPTSAVSLFSSRRRRTAMHGSPPPFKCTSPRLSLLSTPSPRSSIGSSEESISRRRSAIATRPDNMPVSDLEVLINSMTWGVGSVVCDARQGLPKDYIEKFIDAVEKRGCTWGHRPVDAMCKLLFSEGFPTKPFEIKGKSSNWGLHQSFICTDQHYSKLYDSDEKTIEKFNKEVESINEKCAVREQLKIPWARIDELEKLEQKKDFEDQKIIRLSQEENEEGVVCKIRFKVFRPDWTECEQQVELAPDGYWRIYNIIQGKPEPLLALTEPLSRLPIIADVDPLFEAYHWENDNVDLGGRDRLPVPLIAPKVVQQRLSVYKQRAESRNAREESPSIRILQDNTSVESLLKPEVPGIGNASRRTSDMIDCYGESKKSLIDRKHPLVHHNIDSTSPFSDESSNYPATIYFPSKVLKNINEFNKIDENNECNGVEKVDRRVVMVHSSQQFQALIQVLKNNHYFMHLNPLWKDTHARRPDWFHAARKKLEDTLPSLTGKRKL